MGDTDELAEMYGTTAGDPDLIDDIIDSIYAAEQEPPDEEWCEWPESEYNPPFVTHYRYNGTQEIVHATLYESVEYTPDGTFGIGVICSFNVKPSMTDDELDDKSLSLAEQYYEINPVPDVMS